MKLLYRRCAGMDVHKKSVSVCIRRRVHGNYLIFYKVARDRIAVIRILHGAMDYEAHLF